MTVELCEECGFDGSLWSDSEAVAAIGALAERWARAIEGLHDATATRRPITGMWSVAEYTDHVREVMFGMRFVLDAAIDTPGANLGPPPASRFDPEPRDLDLWRAHAGFARETGQLHDQLTRIPAAGWESSVVLNGEEVDVHWIARHAVHDVTHHLGDVARLRAALDPPTSGD